MSIIRSRIDKGLTEIRSQNLERKLKPPCGYDFSSNDYFQLAGHPRIIDAVKSSLDSYGYGSTSSRFIRGERTLYGSIQARLAHFKRCEQVLIFTSGYAANLGVLSSLINKGDIVFSDRLNHASLIDGLKLSGATIIIFPHRDADFIARALQTMPKKTVKFIVTEAMFSMDGTKAPLTIYAELARQYDLGLIIDEAHSVGLYGHKGAGLIDHAGISEQLLCSTNGLGKAFAALGAFIGGDAQVVELVQQKARTLMYTTALPPAALCAIEAALNIIEQGDQLRAKLFETIDYFSGQLLEKNLMPRRDFPSPIMPVHIGDAGATLKSAQYLQNDGFDIRAIRPPTVPAGSSRLRISVNLSHTPELIDRLLRSLEHSI